MVEENKDDNQDLPRADGDNRDEAIKGEADGTQVTPPVAPEGNKDENVAANNDPEKPVGFNAETSHKELLDRHGKLEKSYSEIRRAYTQASQRAAEQEKKLDEMMKMLSKATETQIDPQQFIRDVQSRGHEPIVELIQKEREKLQADLEGKYGKMLEESQAQTASLEASFLKEQMRNDAVNFPGFKELEGVMGELVEDPNLPINPNAPIAQQMVALYKLAKSRSAETAINEAHAKGAADKEKELAKEANTTVAGGGKAAGTTVPDFDKLGVDEHRKRLIDLYGIAER